jgi:hypothetical protein
LKKMRKILFFKKVHILINYLCHKPSTMVYPARRSGRKRACWALPRGPETERLLQAFREYRHIPGTQTADGKWEQINPDMYNPEIHKGGVFHEGDLLQHSLWSEAYIRQWYGHNSVLTRGIQVNVALAAALLHDIGKGGDCIRLCYDQKCVYDVYAPHKYDGRGADVHPEFSADILTGSRPFYTQCEPPSAPIDIQSVLKELGVYTPRDRAAVVLCGMLHWEFGKINFRGSTPVAQRVADYLQSFYTACQKTGLQPTETLLRTCIAVSCADIAAGSPRRLTCATAPPVYTNGNDPWVAFGMDKAAPFYLSAVIALFHLRGFE